MISVGVIAGSGQGTYPSAVTSSAAQTSFNSITLSWTAPFNGGAPITSYSYQVSTDNSTWGTAVNAGNVTSIVVGSLASPGATYYFRVLATNSIGSGPYGASCSAATAKASTAIFRSNITIGSTTYYGNQTPPAGGQVHGINYVIACDTLTSPDTGLALSGKTIIFEHFDPGMSGYEVIGSAVTNSSGYASATLSSNNLSYGNDAGYPEYYRCRFAGDAQYNAVTQTNNIVQYDFQWV
jgi:hypothetical protein